MKRLSTLIILTLAMVANTFAQQIANVPPFEMNEQLRPNTQVLERLDPEMLGGGNGNEIFEDKHYDLLMYMGDTVIFERPYYSAAFKVTPMAYEPFSDTYVYAVTSFINNGNDEYFFDSKIEIYYKKGDEATWNNFTAHETSKYAFTNASLGVLNPDNDPNASFEDLVLFMTTTYYEYSLRNGDWSYWYVRGQFVATTDIVDKPNFLTYDKVIETPDGFADQFYGIGEMVAHGKWFYRLGNLSPLTDDGGNYLAQYGAVGFMAYNYEDEEFIFTYPDEWHYSLFKDGGSLSGSYQGTINIDVDGEGNVYVAFNNIIKANNPDEIRVPLFSKSSDNGETWTDFEPFPFTTYRDFLTQQGFTAQEAVPQPGGNFPYQQNAFVVTGVDEFHYVMRVLIWGDDGAGGSDLQARILADFYKKDGQWGVQKVTDFVNIPYQLRVLENPDLQQDVDYYIELSRGNELQMTYSENEGKVGLKWVDYNIDEDMEIVVINPPQTVWFQVRDQADQETTLDSLNPTDIYLITKDLATNTWDAEAKNLTEDTRHNKCSFVATRTPSVSDLSKIPGIVSLFALNREVSTENNRYGYDPYLINMAGDGIYQNAAVNFEVIVGVEDEEIVNEVNLLANPAPNPAMDRVELSFNMEFASHVNIDIVDITGKKIANVYDNFAASDKFEVNLDSESFSTGSYFIAMTVNGKTYTKLLNVIR
jgi:hypothetical protein